MHALRAFPYLVISSHLQKSAPYHFLLLFPPVTATGMPAQLFIQLSPLTHSCRVDFLAVVADQSSAGEAGGALQGALEYLLSHEFQTGDLIQSEVRVLPESYMHV